MNHVPMCLYCDHEEVAAPFTNTYGEGFCSAKCERTAAEEFADAFAESEAEFERTVDKEFADAHADKDACSECGAEGKYYDDLCYQCQCELHAIGKYNMDEEGW
jgi:hypothetical protein